jgi:calcium/calmodulin-dependent protein kinase I
MPRIGSIITYVLLCGYSPFRSDDMKELVRQTTEAKITFHDRYWSNVSEEGTVSSHTHLNSPIYLTHRHTAKGFIRALLNPDPTKRLTASEALTHPWLTTTPSPSTSQPDLSGLRENFDPRARWRNAIGAARAITRMGGLAQRSRSKLVSSDDDDDGEEGDTTSLKVPSPKALRTSSSSSSSIAMAISPSQPEKPAAAAAASQSCRRAASSAGAQNAREGDVPLECGEGDGGRGREAYARVVQLQVCWAERRCCEPCRRHRRSGRHMAALPPESMIQYTHTSHLAFVFHLF